MAPPDIKLKMLKSVPLFASMRQKDLEEVEQLADSVDLPAGKTLMRQGDAGDEMYVIASGSVRVERNGKEVATLGPGEAVGEIALLSEGPRLATVSTLEPTTAFVIGHREFHTLLGDSAELRQCILDNLAKRIRTLDELGTL
jgi:CRP/FNR family transcriptional regulator, cyclic AMP receptor protein